MKNTVKKNYLPFAAGMLTMVLLAVLVSATLAKNETHSGQISPEVSYGQVGVGLFLREQVAAGESRTTEKGASVPKVLTYTDEKGEDHYYIEAETVAKIFDVGEGVHYREELKRVEFGATPLVTVSSDEATFRVEIDGEPVEMEGNGEPALDEDGNPRWWTAGERHDFRTMEVDGVVIGYGVSPGPGGYWYKWRTNDVKRDKETWENLRARAPRVPEYGVKGGMYTEVDPAEVDMGSVSGISMDRKSFQDWEIVEHTFAFTPVLGKYGVITIENVSKADVYIYMSHPTVVGWQEEQFTCVCIPAGEKLARAFRIDDEADALKNEIYLKAMTLGEEGVDLLLSAEQYRN
ncbi:MAG: hypothetical protein HFF90_05475 [Oscillibacter sp.]|nr:hypothetical protein [Oscillibacter sp.]